VQQGIKGQEPHAVPPRNRLTGRTIDQAIADHGRGQDSGPLIGKQNQTALGINRCAQKLSTSVWPRPIKVSFHQQRPRYHVSHPLQAQDQRPNGDQKGNQTGDRVSWQSNEMRAAMAVGAAHGTKRQGLAGLHGDLPQSELALGLNRGFDMVFFTDRHATRTHNQIRAARSLAPCAAYTSAHAPGARTGAPGDWRRHAADAAA